MSALHYHGRADESAGDILGQKHAALSLLRHAFEQAGEDGVDPDCMTQAALFFVLKEFVTVFGEEPVARFAEGLPRRIRSGEFTLHRHG